MFIGFLFVFTLTGCFAEDYDVGVPTAHLYIDSSEVQLAEAIISWETASEDVQKTIADLEEYAASLNAIEVSSGEKALLDFKENEENGGDIWTDPKITVCLLKENERIELELVESKQFRFPKNRGNYVLEVEFINTAGKVQYIGNIVIH